MILHTYWKQWGWQMTHRFNGFTYWRQRMQNWLSLWKFIPNVLMDCYLEPTQRREYQEERLRTNLSDGSQKAVCPRWKSQDPWKGIDCNQDTNHNQWGQYLCFTAINLECKYHTCAGKQDFVDNVIISLILQERYMRRLEIMIVSRLKAESKGTCSI